MEVLQPHPMTERIAVAAPANDDCLYRPVVSMPRRHPAMHHPQLPRRLAAVALALAFCLWWVVLRSAAPAEVAEMRMQLAAQSGPAAVERFDARLAAHPQASLLRLELMRQSSRS